MSYWTFCVRLLILITLQTKKLTQIWGIYKNSSKKGFLDSMDWREATYSGVRPFIHWVTTLLYSTSNSSLGVVHLISARKFSLIHHLIF